MNQPRIVSTPDTCGGRPRLDGTRLGVDFFKTCWKSGMTDQDILDEYGENYPPGFLAAGIVAVREWLFEIGNPRRDREEVERLRKSVGLRVACIRCEGTARTSRRRSGWWRRCPNCDGRGWTLSRNRERA